RRRGWYRIRRQFLAADKRQIETDLDRHVDAVDLDIDLRVDVPAERAGRELLDQRIELLFADGDADGLGLGPELGARDGTGAFLRHDSPFPGGGVVTAAR